MRKISLFASEILTDVTKTVLHSKEGRHDVLLKHWPQRPRIFLRISKQASKQRVMAQDSAAGIYLAQSLEPQ